MKMKILAAFLLVTLFLTSSIATTTMATSAPPPTTRDGYSCDEKCGARCAKAGVKDRCLKYCGICCDECKCVPSGTFGNKHECPCYRDKTNSKGKPKCP